MIALSYKSKQYGLIALKVLILSLTFGYIYQKITQNKWVSFSEFMETINQKNSLYIAFFLGLAAANWIFEILKWQTVVSAIKKISFAEATRQSLIALTVSLSTPNRIGDYGAKAYFFSAENRKKGLLLNLFSNLSQMTVTFIFGLFGLIYISNYFDLSFSATKIMMLIGVFIVIIIIGVILKKKEFLVTGLSIEKMSNYIKKLPAKVKVKTAIYSLVRYVIFSALFFFLLNFFGAEITTLQAMPIIFAMYLLVSIIPTFFIFDVVIRGGIAVWLFSFTEIPEWPVLYTVFTMWLLNFVIPAICGGFYMITYRRT